MNPEETEATRKSFLWCGVFLLFTLATAGQVFFYGSPHLFGFVSYHLRLLYVPAALVFLFLPFAVIPIVGRPVQRLHGTQSAAFASLFGWALLFSFVGVFIAFNLFGT